PRGAGQSESSFRHQLEADIEPFRGLLLGLFFLAVGLSLRLDVVLANWPLICAGVVAMMVVKGLCIYAVARVLRSSRAEALDRAILMAQGGEFAFVLYQAANQGQVINDQVNANMTAIIVLSMVLTPLVVLAHARLARKPQPSLEGVEPARDLKGCVLIVGFGRVGQIASQGLLASGAEISLIDNDPEVIRNAEKYGFKVYYGDGARSDVLRAAGLDHMQVVLVCVDDKDAATRIVENVHDISPQTKVLVRAWDREHAVALVKQDADYVVRETFESAMLLGREAVRALGASDLEADEYMQEVRRRDAERFALETTGGIFAGRDLILGNMARKHP
ncbi:NAD-binding protein, partial [Bordetella hinzii]|uniref:NAD-binding protein n=1 Tax=Bordetella hinzii TaxID=103855 RepID=UPI003F1DA144